jgi:glycosyltransferase 2 family protein
LTTSTPKPPYLGRIGWVILCFVLVVGTAVVLTGWSEAKVALAQLSLGKIALLVALTSLHYAMRALRWHLLVVSGGASTRFSQNLLHLLGGFAMTATPGRLGELIRLRWLHRQTGLSLFRLAPIAFADRAIELASMLLLIFAMLAFTNLESDSAWILIVVATSVVALMCQPRLLELVSVSIWRILNQRKARKFAKLRRMIRHLGRIMTPKRMLPILVFGALGWACEGLAFWVLLGWLDIPLAFPTATTIFMVAILAGALSGLPGGLGGAEATGVGLLVLQSIPVENAVLAVLIIRITTLWFTVVVGMIAFPFAEMSANRNWSDVSAVP